MTDVESIKAILARMPERRDWRAEQADRKHARRVLQMLTLKHGKPACGWPKIVMASSEYAIGS